MYLEGKSYYQISCVLDDERVLFPEKKIWRESTVRAIINNPVYVGDYINRKGQKSYENGIYYQDVVALIITRAEWEEVQKQKEKNKQAFCRDRIYFSKDLNVLNVVL